MRALLWHAIIHRDASECSPWNMRNLFVPFLTRRNTQREQRRSRMEEEHHRLMDLRRTSREVLLLCDDELREMRDAADRCAIYGLNFVGALSAPI